MNPSQLVHLAVFGAVMILLSRRLPAFALKRPVTLGMILGALFLCGFVALSHLPVELMPNVSYGNVTVFIDVRGGMPPPEVERLVTKPVEEAMGTVSRLRNLISSSKKDRSVVTLEFEPDTDMDLAAMEVREKFLRVKPKLPREIEKPVIARYEESDAPVVIAALTSDNETPEKLREHVDADLKEKLMRVDGVANVEVGGGRERKIVVDVDREKMAAVHLPIHKIVGVLEQNNLNLRTGEVSGGDSLLGVRAVGVFADVDEIRDITLSVAKNGGRVRLKDVAEVKDSFLEQESYSRLNAKAAVTIYVQKETSGNTVRVAGKVLEELDAFRAHLPKGVDLVVISNQRRAILEAINSVRVTLVYGIALVVLVLPLFLATSRLTRAVVGVLLALLVATVVVFYLFRWPLDETDIPVMLVTGAVFLWAFRRPDIRSSLVVSSCIPASVMMTLAFMYVEGISINVMSLSGLILGIGLLVDNAVVVIENYDRLCRERRDLSRREAMLKACDEMVSSIVGGTLTTVVVFLPFSLLAKQSQMLFAGISFSVTASLFSSLFVALTLVPALGALVDPLKHNETPGDDRVKSWAAATRAWAGKKSARFRAWVVKPRFSAFNVDVSPAKAGTQDSNHPSTPHSEKGNSLVFDVIPAKAGIQGLSFQKWIPLLFLFALILFCRFAFDLPVLSGLYFALAAGLIGVGLWGMGRYQEGLSWCLRNRRKVYVVVGAVFAAALGIFLWALPKDFMASSEQSEFVVFVELDTGVRLDISNKAVQEVEQTVRDFAPTKDAIKSVSSKVEGWSSKVYVTLVPLSERRFTTQQVIDRLRPAVEKTVDKYAADYKAFCYFSEPRSGKEIFVELYGYDYDLMAKIAIDVAGRMGKIPGLSDVKIRYRPGRPQLSVYIDPLRAALFGMDAKGISESLHAQMRGLRATTFYDRAKEVETVVRLRPDQRETIDQMKNLLLTTGGGDIIPLQQVSKVRGDLSPSEVWHRNRSRMIQVSANLGNTTLEEAAGSVKKAIAQISFPAEYYADIGGQYEDMVQANRDFWKALVLTVFLVFLVMACQFESYSRPFLLMGTVPLSLIGSVAALCLFKSTVTMGVSVGLLMLGGIVVNHGIMLIDCLEALKARRPEEDLPSLVLTAGLQRIRPIFMTTCTTVIGLLPMALDRSESAVLWSPLAITVLGGLISATVLTLFVIPCLILSMETALPVLRRLPSLALHRAKFLFPAREPRHSPSSPRASSGNP